MFPRKSSIASIALVSALIAAGCGGDDPVADSGADTEMELVDDGAISDDGVDDADQAEGDDHIDDADMDDADTAEGDDHDHEEGITTEWPAEFDVPMVDLDAVVEEGGVVELSIGFTGFTLVSGDIDEVGANEGHVHVFVDGVDMGMFFQNEVRLTGVSPGTHQLMVELSAADHSVFVVDDSPLRYMSEIVVPGETEQADVIIDVVIDASGGVDGVIEVDASIGDMVEIRVDSAVDEELHVHAYDHTLEVGGDSIAVLRFEALIPGVFEVELEGSGRQVIQLTVS